MEAWGEQTEFRARREIVMEDQNDLSPETILVLLGAFKHKGFVDFTCKGRVIPVRADLWGGWGWFCTRCEAWLLDPGAEKANVIRYLLDPTKLPNLWEMRELELKVRNRLSRR